MLKRFFADWIVVWLQHLALAVWLGGQLLGRWGRAGYLRVMIWRRRMKGEALWQEHDWTFLGVPPPPGHPRAQDFSARAVVPIEVMPVSGGGGAPSSSSMDVQSDLDISALSGDDDPTVPNG